MKKVVRPLVVSLVALSATTAMADAGKWYIGAGGGQSIYREWPSKSDITNLMNDFGTRLGVDRYDGTHQANTDDKDNGYKVFGGYAFADTVAVEVAYINMGEVEAYSNASGTFYDVVNNSLSGDLYTRAQSKVEAVTLDLKADFPIVSFVSVILRGGLYTADNKIKIHAGSTFSTQTFSYDKTETTTGLHYGAGLSFKLTDAIALQTEWERLNGVEANGGNSNVDLISGSLVYKF